MHRSCWDKDEGGDNSKGEELQLTEGIARDVDGLLSHGG